MKIEAVSTMEIMVKYEFLLIYFDFYDFAISAKMSASEIKVYLSYNTCRKM